VGANISISVSNAITVDASDNVYFSSYSNNSCTCVFKLDPSVLTRVAGSAQRGFSGDGGPATSAQLGRPSGLAVDGAGNLFIADPGVYHSGTYGTDRVRKVSPDGIITTVAGGGSLWGSSADGGPATSAQLLLSNGVAVDRAGNLYFSEGIDAAGLGNNRIRKVSPDGIITTVAGDGTSSGFSGDGGPATSAQLAGPASLAIDNASNLFFVDYYNNRIRMVSPDGTITTVVDTGGSTSQNCGCSVTSVTVDRAGNLFYSVYTVYSVSTLFKRSPTGVITTAAGTDFGGGVWGLAVDAAGNLFLTGGSNLRKILADGFITTLLGDNQPPMRN
jgi:sugar lactone lactonase YvrE